MAQIAPGYLTAVAEGPYLTAEEYRAIIAACRDRIAELEEAEGRRISEALDPPKPGSTVREEVEEIVAAIGAGIVGTAVCPDCDGSGYVVIGGNDIISDPPERELCLYCSGRGRVSEDRA